MNNAIAENFGKVGGEQGADSAQIYSENRTFRAGREMSVSSSDGDREASLVAWNVGGGEGPC